MTTLIEYGLEHSANYHCINLGQYVHRHKSQAIVHYFSKIIYLQDKKQTMIKEFFCKAKLGRSRELEYVA